MNLLSWVLSLHWAELKLEARPPKSWAHHLGSPCCDFSWVKVKVLIPSEERRGRCVPFGPRSGGLWVDRLNVGRTVSGQIQFWLACEAWAWQSFIFPTWWNMPSNTCPESVLFGCCWLCDVACPLSTSTIDKGCLRPFWWEPHGEASAFCLSCPPTPDTSSPVPFAGFLHLALPGNGTESWESHSPGNSQQSQHSVGHGTHLVRSAPQAPPSILTISSFLLLHILLALSQANTRKNSNRNLLSFGAYLLTQGFGSMTRRRRVIKKRSELLYWREGQAKWKQLSSDTREREPQFKGASDDSPYKSYLWGWLVALTRIGSFRHLFMINIQYKPIYSIQILIYIQCPNIYEIKIQYINTIFGAHLGLRSRAQE